MFLSLLGGVGDKRAEKLLQLLASARGALHVMPFVLLWRHDDQRFLTAVQAFIVIHRHRRSPLLLTEDHERVGSLVQEGMRDAAQHHARQAVASAGPHEDEIRIRGLGFLKYPLDRGSQHSGDPGLIAHRTEFGSGLVEEVFCMTERVSLHLFDRGHIHRPGWSVVREYPEQGDGRRFTKYFLLQEAQGLLCIPWPLKGKQDMLQGLQWTGQT